MPSGDHIPLDGLVLISKTRPAPMTNRALLRDAERAGFDPAVFSGHSLRACFLTSPPPMAIADGLNAAEIPAPRW
jgi:hypothetical protein